MPASTPAGPRARSWPAGPSRSPPAWPTTRSTRRGVATRTSSARPPRRAWAEGFALGGLAFAAVPLVNLLTTTRGLPRSLAAADWTFAGFDLAMLAIALLLGVAAVRAGRAPRLPVSRRSKVLVDA